MKKIGVLGTGTMGAGIIQVLAQNGFEVVLRARRQTSVDKGIATVEKNLDKLIAKEKLTAEEKTDIMSRIKGSIDIEIIKDADLVIEAATEDMVAKKHFLPNWMLSVNQKRLSQPTHRPYLLQKLQPQQIDQTKSSACTFLIQSQ